MVINTKEEKTFKEIWEELISQAEKSLKIIQNTLKLVLSWENKELNGIIKNLFLRHKDEFKKDYKLFNRHIVNWLKEYLEFAQKFWNNWIKNKRDEQISLRVWIFEETYHEILYYWQDNRVVWRTEQLAEITRKKVLEKLN